MKKNLIILNYQRVIPPFMVKEIEIANQIYDNITYITPLLQKFNNNSDKIKLNNVSILQISRVKWILGLIKVPILILRKEVREEIFKVIKEKKFTFKFLIDYIKKNSAAELLKLEAFKIIETINPHENITVLATWFSSEAYAAAQIKRKYKNLKCVSLAHSFEVDPAKNDYIDYNFNKILHEKLDNINFISKNVYKVYKKEVMDKYGITDKNISFSYLGSEKLGNELSQVSEDGIFRIVSCSGVTSVKRLHLILNSIKNWNRGKIEWTHLGSGPLFDSLLFESNIAMENNENISIKLRGHYDNEEVHQFYINNPCDLFINISSSEGIPVSLMECMSYGIPVIATNVGGNSEIVNEHNGFLVDKNINEIELKKILENYLECSSKQKKKYRDNAYQMWKNKFQSQINIFNYFNEVLK